MDNSATTSTAGVTATFFQQLLNSIANRYLFGHDQLIKYFAVAYLARGHILIEGPPGTGKTLTAKLMAHCLSRSFRRIQFTSDMLPGDLIGSHLYNPAKSTFDFIRGPLFSDFIIADEINRTSPRTQSALLEAMEERQVTVEGKTIELPAEFFVVATQNPQEFEGTYPLPEAQLDRFLFKLVLDHSPRATEAEILEQVLKGSLPPALDRISTVALDRANVDSEIGKVAVDPHLLDYIAQLLEQTRKHPNLSWGSSIRGGIALARCARVIALLEGRQFVIPDDIKTLAIPVLRHRVRLSPEAQVSNVTEASVMEEIISTVPFPG